MRTTVRTQCRNPPRKGFFVRVCYVRLPSPLATSCFAALAKNSHLRTVFTALRAAASRQCDCHVARCAPRNDKGGLGARLGLKLLILIKCHERPYSLSFRGSETTVGISRKRNESSGDRRQFFIIICVRVFPFLLRGISRLRSK